MALVGEEMVVVEPAVEAMATAEAEKDMVGDAEVMKVEVKVEVAAAAVETMVASERLSPSRESAA